MTFPPPSVQGYPPKISTYHGTYSWLLPVPKVSNKADVEVNKLSGLWVDKCDEIFVYCGVQWELTKKMLFGKEEEGEKHTIDGD